MATTSDINGLPIPDLNSDGYPPRDFKALADALDTLLNARFPSTAERDIAIPSPTKNMECWVDGVGKQVNTDGTPTGWVTVFNSVPWPIFGRLTGSTAQAIHDNGTFQPVLLNQQDKLVNLGVTLSGGIIRCTDADTAGWFSVSAGLNYAGRSGGRRFVGIMKNGALLAPSQNSVFPSTAGRAAVTTSYDVALDVNDYVQVGGFQDSGGDLDVDRTQSFLSVKYICPL